jgi:pseudaminic acid cytidylyltransferase
MRLAVIPARGGSKRIPRKNIKLFGGKPMIAWSIEAALQSGCFDYVLVSTDDNEIAEVAQAYGAEVPFIRPSHLSDDYTTTIPVVAHAIQQLQTKNRITVTDVCCIYATAPFLKGTDLTLGLRMLTDTNADYVFSVTSYPFPIQRAIRIISNQRVEMIQAEFCDIRSQDLKEAWHDAGQFYWGKADLWLSGSPIFGSNSVALPLPRYRVQDIDTFEDWKQAELIFKAFNSQENL